jgi:hypothetical protein
MKSDQMLIEILAWCDDHPEAAEARKIPERQFRDMVAKGRPLSDVQASWVRCIHERLFDVPVYENAFSAGRVPRGEALATPIPEVLKRPLPKRPPVRIRKEED